MLSEVLAQLRVFRLDTIYAMLASLCGIAVGAVWASDSISRPSGIVKEVADWVGVDIAQQVESLRTWLVFAPTSIGTTPISRSDAIAALSFVLLVIALIGVLATAAKHWEPGETRAASTAWIALTVYLETGTTSGNFEIVVVVLLVIVWVAWNALRRGWDDAIIAAAIAILDLVLVLSWMPLTLIVWTAFSIARKPSNADEKANRS